MKVDLDKLIIIIDTREKHHEGISHRFSNLGLQTIRRKLNTGDYSYEYDGKSYETEFAIEKKQDFSELHGNLTVGHARFSREFTRALEIPRFYY